MADSDTDGTGSAEVRSQSQALPGGRTCQFKGQSLGKHRIPNVCTGGSGWGLVWSGWTVDRGQIATPARVLPRCQATKPPAPPPTRPAARMKFYILGKSPNPEPRCLCAGLPPRQVEDYYNPVPLGTIPGRFQSSVPSEPTAYRPP